MFYKALVVLSLAVVAAGCMPSNVDPGKIVAAPDGAEAATAEIMASYEIQRAAPPTVIWYGGAALNCVDPAKPWCDGGRCWRSDNGAGCTAGEELDDGVLLVSDFGGAAPIHETPLAHEIAHYASQVREGNPDTNHTGHFFAPGGDLDAATAVLAAAGM